jgi:hypothetical protein
MTMTLHGIADCCKRYKVSVTPVCISNTVEMQGG